MFFNRKKRTKPEAYDREKLRPAIRVSICTGEEVAGFRDLQTGKFHDVLLLREDADLREFMERYGLTETPPREY